MVFTRKDGDFHGRTVSFREGMLLVYVGLSSTRLSMEVSNWLVSWLFITYLRDLQATYKGVIIHLLSTMDIPVF